MDCISDPDGKHKGEKCAECPWLGIESDCPCFKQATWWRVAARFAGSLVANSAKKRSNAGYGG